MTAPAEPELRLRAEPALTPAFSIRELSALIVVESEEVIGAPMVIAAAEALEVLIVVLNVLSAPATFTVPLEVRLKAPPLDAESCTLALSLMLTSPAVLAESKPAFVCTVILPEPEPRESDAAVTLPEMAPPPSALSVAEPADTIFAPSVIEPPELLDVLRLMVLALSTAELVRVPLAESPNELPLEDVRFTDELSNKVTLPAVLAERVAAFVWTFIVPEPDLRLRTGAKKLPEIAPAPSAEIVAKMLAVRFAPSMIEAPEPLAVLKLTVPPVMTPLVLILPPAARTNVLPLDAPKFTTALSERLTSPVVLAERVPALLCTVIDPDAELSCRDGAEMLPLITPNPSAEIVADALAVRYVDRFTDPPEPAALLKLALLAASKPDNVILPLALRLNVLPLDAPKLTEPLSVSVTLPELLAVTLPALV